MKEWQIKQTNQKKPLVNLLWTGGWDSTFRLLQLSDKDIIVQPHYLIDAGRRSQYFELNAIRSITDDILKRPSTRCTIRELIKVHVSEIEEDTEVTQAYTRIAANHKLGIQYEWLARYSKNVNDLEIGDENGRAIDSILLSAIKSGGAIQKVTDDVRGEYYKVDKAVSSADIIRVFGNYNYPILFYNKLEMKKEAEEKGFIDVMNKTWFCHSPIDYQPCGRCVACAGTIKKGLEYRLNKKALVRYRRKKLLEPLKESFMYNSGRKIKRLIQTVFLQSGKGPGVPVPPDGILTGGR